MKTFYQKSNISVIVEFIRILSIALLTELPQYKSRKYALLAGASFFFDVLKICQLSAVANY
jgi:hypothetical protein